MNAIDLDTRILDIEELSNKSRNICSVNSIKTVYDLIEYYRENRSFRKIRSCGKKSNDELLNFCKIFKDSIINSPREEETDYLEQLNESIENINIVKELSLSLSVRAQNIINNICNSNKITIIEALMLLKDNPKSNRNIGQKTAEELLNFISSIISNKSQIIIEGNYQSDINDKNSEYVGFIEKIKNRFSLDLSNEQIDFKNDFFLNKLPFSKLLSSFFFTGKYFDNVEKTILRSVVGLGNKNLSEIAIECGLTRERVRQKKERLFKTIFYKYGIFNSFINEIKPYSIIEFDIPDKNILCFDKSLFLNNTDIAQEQFSDTFLCKLITYFYDDFCSISFDKKSNKLIDVFTIDNFAKSYDITNNYLLKNEIKIYCVGNFISYFSDLFQSKRKTDIVIDKHSALLSINTKYKTALKKHELFLKNSDRSKSEKLREAYDSFVDELGAITSNKTCCGLYLKNSTEKLFKGIKLTYKFWRSIDFTALSSFDVTYYENINEEVKNNILNYFMTLDAIQKSYENSIIEAENNLKDFFKDEYNVFLFIAHNEFGVDVNEDRIFLNKNTEKSIIENILDILEVIDHPLHVDEIVKEFSKKGIDISKDLIRSNCQRSDEIISFSRSSTYGLKKWEKERTNIKGGSIREIVQEYLESFNDPVHISKITDHVLQYRDTYLRSVLDNLKADPEVFCFFPKGYIGLKTKQYSNESGQLTFF